MFQALIEKLRERHRRRRDDALKLRQGTFDFEDFLRQMDEMRRAGPFDWLFRLIPGVSYILNHPDFTAGEREMRRFQAIVRSMSKRERRRPEIIDDSRLRRIAAGASVPMTEVSTVLRRFDEMKAMM